MLSEAKFSSPDQCRGLKLEMGKWLRDLREAQSLSQRDLANRLNLDYYTFISQLENGRGKIPSARYAEWADALEVSQKEFVERILYFTEPVMHKILFEEVC